MDDDLHLFPFERLNIKDKHFKDLGVVYFWIEILLAVPQSNAFIGFLRIIKDFRG